MAGRAFDPPQVVGSTPLAAPAPIEPPTKDPPPLLRVAGLVALVTMVTLDAYVTDFNPDPWVYGIAALIVWGPGMLPGLGRK